MLFFFLGSDSNIKCVVLKCTTLFVSAYIHPKSALVCHICPQVHVFVRKYMDVFSGVLSKTYLNQCNSRFLNRLTGK